MPDNLGTLKAPRLASAPSSPVVGQMYYNTTTSLLYFWSGTAWVAASGGGGGMDLSFDGDWVAGTYQEGDHVVKDGILWECVGGPTSVAPDASLWSLGPTIPTVVDKKWLRVSGGAMLWDDPAGYIAGQTVGSANMDLTLPKPSAPLNTIRIDQLGAGSIRSVQAAPAGYQLEIQQAWSATMTPITLKHELAGGTGIPLHFDSLADMILSPGATARFTCYQGTLWVCSGITFSAATDWITLPLNASFATHYTAPYGPARYRRTSSGMVVMDGLVVPQVATINVIYATMPVGYRPSPQGGARDLIFTLACSGGPANETWRINNSGELRPQNGIQVGGWSSLAGLSYYAGSGT